MCESMVASRIEHGEIPGMLDRDQRTVRTRSEHQQLQPATSQQHVYNSRRRFVCLAYPMSSPVQGGCGETPSDTSEIPLDTISCGHRTRKSRTPWRIAQRLKKVFVLSVYLLSVIYIPRTSCAPTSRSQMAERMNSHPKWINPCGMGSNDMPHDAETMFVSDKDLLNQIVGQARIALSQANLFREDYVRKTFNMDFEQHHKYWETQRYDWLPSWTQIPKKLGQKPSTEHLENLQLNTSLLDTYEYLQKLAVGLEQIVWDQEDEDGAFHSSFMDTEFKLRALLCEMQVAILERGLSMRADVTRDIMTDEYRQMNTMSYRNLRDWLIFRDYMNALEYVIEVFEHFKKDL